MGFFDSFVKRVMDAVKIGRLQKKDSEILSNFFMKAKVRNKVLAHGILSALNTGRTGDSEIKKLSKLLENANERIEQGRKPFSPSDEKDLRSIFDNAGLSIKTAKWFSLNMDQFLSNEINDEIVEKSAAKKIVRFSEKKIRN